MHEGTVFEHYTLALHPSTTLVPHPGTTFEMTEYVRDGGALGPHPRSSAPGRLSTTLLLTERYPTPTLVLT